MLALGTAGVTSAQTVPGVAGGFETLGALYSGRGPFQDPPIVAGDGWASGISGVGVLDADGNPSVDPLTGELFRALHQVDYNWASGGGGTDLTVFAGSNKNNDSISPNQGWSWETGGAGPKKNDLTNGYLHTRIDAATGDRWVYVGAETRSTSGDSHVDFEFNQAGIEKVGSEVGGRLVGLGPDGGRTVDDFMISIDFSNGGEHPTGSVRFWNGNAYVEASAPGAVFAATNLGTILHGSDGLWKHYAENGAAVEIIEPLQFVEAAVNLTALGIDVDPCSTNATFTVKTRSSTSFTADLKDFILVPFPLEPTPNPVLDGPEVVCPGTVFGVTVQDLNNLPGAFFEWNVSGPATIVDAEPGGETIYIQVDELACFDDIVASAGVTAGNCLDTTVPAEITVSVADVDGPVLDGVPDDVPAECDAVPEPADVVATDACSGTIVDFAEVSEPGACASQYTVIRTWTAIDDCGNIVSETQMVFVDDTTPPVITPSSDLHVYVCDRPVTMAIGVTDNCGGAFLTVDAIAGDPELVTLVRLDNARFELTVSGATMITVMASAMDDCGNESDATYTVEALCGGEACSAGYWRNNLDSWCVTRFNPLPDDCYPGPATTFLSAFLISDTSAAPASFDPALTLHEAVNTPNGGEFNHMMFQGAAALLNAASPWVDDYPATVSEIRGIMRDAFSAAISFSQATALFNLNNAVEGECGCPTEPPPAEPITTCDDNVTTCTEDLDGDGTVGFSDLTTLLGSWGPCPVEGSCDADLDQDGTVGFNDLTTLLGSWGPCD
jgi:hypothetical protein